jgi:anti-anti-sigma factor
VNDGPRADRPSVGPATGEPAPERPALHIEFSSAAGVTVATVTGDLDHGTCPEAARQLVQQAGGKPLVLDLTRTPYVDSAGVALIESLHRATSLACVVPERSAVERIFTVTGLHQVVATHATFVGALGAFGDLPASGDPVP